MIETQSYQLGVGGALSMRFRTRPRDDKVPTRQTWPSTPQANWRSGGRVPNEAVKGGPPYPETNAQLRSHPE